MSQTCPAAVGALWNGIWQALAENYLLLQYIITIDITTEQDKRGSFDIKKEKNFEGRWRVDALLKSTPKLMKTIELSCILKI